MWALFEPDIINGADFNLIVSGADPDRIKSGSLHLFEDERLPYEILYIKLSFIENVFDKISGGVNLLGYPDLGFSPESIWIRLFPAYNGLPALWNFQVEIIEKQSVENNDFSGIFPKSPPGYAFSFLGVIWLFILGINGKNGLKACRKSIEYLFGLISQNRYDSYFSLPDNKKSVFRPENIFFMPDDKHVPERFREYWEKSFDMACNLLSPEYDAPVSQIKDNIKKLKHEIRREMLGLAPLRKSLSENKDEAILKILKNIENKWTASAGSDEKISDEPEDMEETVIISRKPTEEKDMPETVVISGATKAPVPEEEDMPETVVISGATKAPVPEEDDMPETVVISPAKDKSKTEDDPDIFDKAGDDEDFMMETVILRSGSLNEKPEGKDKKD